MNRLVFNVGSSSVKFAVFEGDKSNPVISRNLSLQENERGMGAAFEQITSVVEEFEIDVIGHRFVHGGSDFPGPAIIDSRVRKELERLAELAPLHQPPALEMLDLASERFPDIPQVAAFDTTFFYDLPRESRIFPVPYDWYEQHGIQRYGFHGLSHQYCAERLTEISRSESTTGCVVIAHLGSGCSLTALKEGKPVATTMGFTPLDGVMMGTRPGSIDPGILLHLLKTEAKTLAQMEDGLQSGSGLLGVSGISSDLREILAAASRGDERAALARDMFCGSIQEHIASLAVRMGKLDHLVFTGGIGSHSFEIRERTLANLGMIGCEIDTELNRSTNSDGRISGPNSPVEITVIQTREELQINRQITDLFSVKGLQRRI